MCSASTWTCSQDPSLASTALFLEPTLSQKASPTAAKRHACTLLPIPLQSPIAPCLCSQTSCRCSHWLCHPMTSPHSGQISHHRSPFPSPITTSTWDAPRTPFRPGLRCLPRFRFPLLTTRHLP